MHEPENISVVIPFYNETDNIPLLYDRLTEAAESWGLDYEVIAIDDGSADDTKEMLAELHARDPRWKLIAFSRNFGHQKAVSAGLYYAHGDAVAVMDSDLQDPPEVIQELIDQWRAGYQVAYAVRKDRKESWFLRLCYWSFYRMLKLMSSIRIPLDTGDFCLMDQRVVRVIRAMPESSTFVRGMRSWAGFKQIGVPYERSERAGGRPKYNLFKLMHLAFDGLVSFSHAPLKLATWIGFAISALSFAFIALLLVDMLVDFQFLGFKFKAVAGRVSILAVISFFSGVQLLFLGIIGEYLARIFDESKSRPRWVIGEAKGLEPPENPRAGGWFAE